MMYKTIVLELIRANHPLHSRLKATKTLLATLDQIAVEFRDRHLELTRLHQIQLPESSEEQARSAAFEIALKEMEEAVANGLPPSGPEAP